MKTTKTTAKPTTRPSRSRSYSPPTPHAAPLAVLIAVLALRLASSNAVGQGTVNFAMTASGVLSTRVYMPDTNYGFWPKHGNTSGQIPPGSQTHSGALVWGNNYVAQLWAAPGANQPESALQLASEVKAFRTGGAAGLVLGGPVTLTNVPADCPVATVQVRAWQSLYFGEGIPSWSQAWNHHGIALGKSLTFNVEAVGGGTNPPPDLLNLRSFSLIYNLLDSPVRPLIFGQPQNQFVAAGDNAVFTVEVASPTLLGYQWQFNGSNISGGGWNPASWGIFDATTNLLQLTNVQPSQAGIYSLTVVNWCCSTNFYPIETLTAVSSNTVLTVGNPGPLTVARDSLRQIVLNWEGVFFLQTATNVGGPFTDLPGPVVFGPYTNPASSGPRFFRLRN